MRIPSRHPRRPRLSLEDELRLAREVEEAEAGMVGAIVRAPAALRALVSVGDRVATGVVRVRDVTRIAEHAPAAARANAARLVAVLARGPAVPRGERRKLAVEIASLRLTPSVLDGAAAAMGERDSRARAAFEQARESSRRAKGEWTAASVHLVVAIAKRYRRAGVETADLIQDGTIGLIRAVEKFDPRLGHRFHAYAAWWIRQHIFRALADYGRSIRVPLPMVEASHRVGRARRVFEGIHGREPTEEELAAASGLDPATVARVDAIIDDPVSLQVRIGDEDTDILDRLADGSSPPPDEQVAQARLHRHMRALFDALAPQERDVIRLRFGFGESPEHSLVEVAALLGVSRERARRLEERALAKLRASSMRAGLGDHLAA